MIYHNMLLVPCLYVLHASFPGILVLIVQPNKLFNFNCSNVAFVTQIGGRLPRILFSSKSQLPSFYKSGGVHKLEACCLEFYFHIEAGCLCYTNQRPVA